MTRYPITYNPIREYWHQIETGEVAVSKKVYKTYRHLIRKLNGETEPEFLYSAARANHVIEFFENYLLEHHITATVRREMGNDIQAACGQLRNKYISKS